MESVGLEIVAERAKGGNIVTLAEVYRSDSLGVLRERVPGTVIEIIG